MTENIWENVPGDPAQQRRRAAMYDVQATSGYWLGLAERAFIFGLTGTGNRPWVEFSHVTEFLGKAGEFGAPIGDGCLVAQLANRLGQESDDDAQLWRSIAGALESVAVERIAVQVID
jgi:hypothetical protein